ncbi:TIGR03749 family integrating conjugative element protein [Methylocaldum sp. 14B]|uniref:TIGR03749 family integrating conjugative element protein n=1 Tax=Methylocaldum sp. 14B TaxID=1912213 RepID=UPI00098B8D9D|nr:TIGR03749 family integrating conjugative element protein [Methylocaldum sp. 14B]
MRVELPIVMCMVVAGLAFADDPAQAPAVAQPALTQPALPGPVDLNSPGPERLIWNKMPLSIALPVNRERMVSFSVPVRVGFPSDLGKDVLRTQIVDGTAYWTAYKAFPVHRIQVQAIGSGNTYLVDLSASEQTGAAAPVEVTLPENTRKTGDGTAAIGAAHSGLSGESQVKRPPQQDYVTLTRMAAQHLYAPERLLRVPEGVYRLPVVQSATSQLIRGGAVEATPVIAWRSGALYVTAVKLRNKTFDDLMLDPRNLRGAWLTCAFQHARLFPRGDEKDTTAAYLISDRPFEEALDGR